MSRPAAVAPDPDPLVIAIDGPAGSGKSTVARAIADRLGLGYLDTGAMYRAATFAVLRRGLDPGDDDEVARVVQDIDLEVDDGCVRVDGLDATVEIRGREVTGAVSAVAANSRVRAELVRRQRRWIADHGGGVVEGRDIASVVYPQADLKVFVTASPRVRAQRRVADIGGTVEEVEASIIERDRKDAGRVDSPLTRADGAIVVDTSEMPIDAVVDHIIGMLP